MSNAAQSGTKHGTKREKSGPDMFTFAHRFVKIRLSAMQKRNPPGPHGLRRVCGARGHRAGAPFLPQAEGERRLFLPQKNVSEEEKCLDRKNLWTATPLQRM